ncbi:HMG-CoA reductase [Companilactobacillus tucceti DSM 20183]|uniref:3-hydroxy-3-methylglutaryl coenzyme A reductase n=1 Tax=Companilactobacillus tucceti DSM 20183 TaxID=1423811 RepID=A0A0R1J8J5_9LACO|nr:hydroxymethylglutaryl-CoA reductase, degradative [Companilactobacillus tucceti]KRK65161.1 HMG-CoA reductase [Companilactobacillus tucceti DSM 20183]
MKVYQMSDEQRIDYLLSKKLISKEQAGFLLKRDPLTSQLSDSLSENQIGLFGLPYGFATDFLIDGKEYLVPMAIEEPSVVAAASNGAKRIKKSGGFVTEPSKRIVTGQIVLENLSSDDILKITESKSHLQNIANESRPSLVERGGGVEEIEFIDNDKFFEIDLKVNTVDAMGANIVNSILEKTAHEILEIVSGDVLCSILSNSGQDQVIVVKAKVDFENLATKTMSGQEVAKRIVKLTEFAKVSTKRAVTHNKGIMNGIDAVLIATGNDFRAQEAAAHSYYEKYRPFSDWKIIDNQLVGELKMPIEVGSVGGAISALPMAKISLAIMQIDNSKQLQSIIGAVGLANNLSALRALVTTGIQAGHMSLQSKSLAVSAGAVGDEIKLVAKKMNQTKKYSLEYAQEILSELRNK